MPVQAPGTVLGTAEFALDVAGKFMGLLASVEGGTAVGNVVEEKPGVDHVVHKHIAGVDYDDIVATCGAGMTKEFYDGIHATLSRDAHARDGSIQSIDYDRNIVSQLEFFHAVLTEVGFPALDASSKQAAKMTVKFSPEYTRLKKGSGKLQPPPGQAASSKNWLTDNFRLAISGLDCSHVNKIDALTIKQNINASAIGKERLLDLQSSSLEVPNLAVTLAESTAQSFYDWHKDFIIDGNNGQNKEKSGTLELLTPDLKEVLFTLTFHGLGIFRLAPEKVEAGNENIRRVKAEMYCETIDFAYGKGAIWG